MKVAYICEPQIGGTFSFYQHIRPLLAEHGVEFCCVPPIAKTDISPRFSYVDGVDAIELPSDLSGATGALIGHLKRQQYDVVITLPSCGILSANLPCYLPRSIRCVMRVPMMTRGAYAPTKAVEAHLNSVVGVSDRVVDDLHQRYAVPSEKLSVIYNGVNIPASLPEREYSGIINVLYTGRISDSDKGIMLFAAIALECRKREIDTMFTLVGSGPDEKQLQAEIQKHSLQNMIKMIPAVSHEKIDSYYETSHVFLLPSRFEGCPNALMEAMANGLVPVASRIHGSVANIVEDGISGFLFDVGDVGRAAEYLDMLSRDFACLNRIRAAASTRIQNEYSIEKTVRQYAAVLKKIMQQQDMRPAQKDIRGYTIPTGMRPTWRTRIPVPIKNQIRKIAERFRLSV